MARIEKTIDVDRPVHMVYSQWTRFEQFPRFMAGVKRVERLGDTRMRWRAEVWGKQEEWDAEITEQIFGQRIAWRSVTGNAPNEGVVRFERLSPERTRVHLSMRYPSRTALESFGEALGVLEARVQCSINEFKKLMEQRAFEASTLAEEWR